MTVEPFGTTPRHEEPKRKRGRFEAPLRISGYLSVRLDQKAPAIDSNRIKGECETDRKGVSDFRFIGVVHDTSMHPKTARRGHEY